VEFETGHALLNAATGFFRFYGSISPGPNSHFYTTDSEEAKFLQDLANRTPVTERRWNYEGGTNPVVFPYLPPDHPWRAQTAMGLGCVTHGTLGDPATGKEIPISRILRFYNNGYVRGVDSNHRFVYEKDVDLIAKMTAEGWKSEGIVFCTLRTYKGGVEMP
jgi:hypothetical protein